MKIQNEQYAAFIDSISDINTRSAYLYFIKLLDEHNVDLATITDKDSLIQTLLALKINNLNNSSTARSTIMNYARFTKNLELFNMIDSMTVNDIWNISKPYAKASLVSDDDIVQMCNLTHRITNGKENQLYISSLLKAIYEGIWEENFEVLANLRMSDVDSNRVKLTYSNGDCNYFSVSKQLLKDLKTVAAEKNWYRVNGQGSFGIPIEGKYEDSVFKVEHRNNANEDEIYMRVYRRKLIAITKEYANYSIAPMNIFMSGIINRVSVLLEDKGLLLQTVLINNHEIGISVIKQELQRCHCSMSYSAFKKFVCGHVFLCSSINE